MALLSWIKNAVMSAVRWIRGGSHLDVNTRPFWQQYNFPAIPARQEVIDRADVVIEGQDRIGSMGPADDLGDIYRGTAYPVTAGVGGPLDTDEASVFAKVKYEDARGDAVHKSIKIKIAWDATIKEFLDMLEADANEVGGDYGLSGAEIVAGSITIG